MVLIRGSEMAEQKAFAAELKALSAVLEALHALDKEQQEFVYQTVGDRLALTGRQTRSDSSRERDVGNGGGSENHDDELTPKEFLRTKNPKTDAERVTCLAYYLTHHREDKTFKTKELTALNTEAAQPKLTNISQTAKNATIQNKYLAQAGAGKKMITTLGEDVVRALPDRDKVNEVLGSTHTRRTRKKRATKKSGAAK